MRILRCKTAAILILMTVGFTVEVRGEGLDRTVKAAIENVARYIVSGIEELNMGVGPYCVRVRKQVRHGEVGDQLVRQLGAELGMQGRRTVEEEAKARYSVFVEKIEVISNRFYQVPGLRLEVAVRVEDRASASVQYIPRKSYVRAPRTWELAIRIGIALLLLVWMGFYAKRRYIIFCPSWQYGRLIRLVMIYLLVLYFVIVDGYFIPML